MTEEFAAQVIVPGVPATLSYRIPIEWQDSKVGSEVIVPIGNREATGWIVDIIPISEAKSALRQQTQSREQSNSQIKMFENDFDVSLKSIRAVRPAFLPEQIKLFSWMSDYYGVPLSEVLETALPNRAEDQTTSYAALTEIGKLAITTSSVSLKSKKQKAILQQLAQSDDPIATQTLLVETSTTSAILSALEKKGLIQIQKRKAESFSSIPEATTKIVDAAPGKLTESQENAVQKIHQAIANNKFEPTLLFGVTGSGKTEVYIRAIQKVLELGGSALLVVPEISLTPQLLDQLSSRLSHPLAVLHSQVGQRARWSNWDALRTGRIRVAIGARSAIFAPATDLRLIIVDEEHESSYKQSDGLRYHGRDLAVMRAKFSDCPVILGSATPSFESLLNVQLQRYKVLELPDRVTNRPLPAIEVVDLKQIKRKEMASENISPALAKALKETLEAKEQAVILYNRRGFSSFLQCDSCGDVVSCKNCSVALTFHKKENKLVCHHCGVTNSPPERCPSCRDPETSRVDLEILQSGRDTQIGTLSHRGGGTERVVDEIAQLFPEAVIARMDRDTVGKKDSYREILGSMRSRQADILVGTQMIAKGHDLPGVTLVGIVDADVGLHLPDFRSAEKTFQLITQAAGRAGRGALQGRVILQTRESNHPAIVAVVTGRFKAFARFQLDYRKSLNYPPYGRLLRIVVSSSDPVDAGIAAKSVFSLTSKIVHELSNNSQKEISASVLGPAPAALERLRGRYRWHILVKSNSAAAISLVAKTLNEWKPNSKVFKDFRMTTDVDPSDMM